MDEEYTNPGKSSGSIFVLDGLIIISLAISVWAFALPLWIPIQIGCVLAASVLKGFSPASGLLSMCATLALDLAVYAFDFPLWPAITIADMAIVFIITHFIGFTTTAMQAPQED